MNKITHTWLHSFCAEINVEYNLTRCSTFDKMTRCTNLVFFGALVNIPFSSTVLGEESLQFFLSKKTPKLEISKLSTNSELRSTTNNLRLLRSFQDFSTRMDTLYYCNLTAKGLASAKEAQLWSTLMNQSVGVPANYLMLFTEKTIKNLEKAGYAEYLEEILRIINILETGSLKQLSTGMSADTEQILSEALAFSKKSVSYRLAVMNGYREQFDDHTFKQYMESPMDANSVDLEIFDF